MKAIASIDVGEEAVGLKLAGQRSVDHCGQSDEVSSLEPFEVSSIVGRWCRLHLSFCLSTLAPDEADNRGPSLQDAATSDGAR